MGEYILPFYRSLFIQSHVEYVIIVYAIFEFWYERFEYIITKILEYPLAILIVSEVRIYYGYRIAMQSLGYIDII